MKKLLNKISFQAKLVIGFAMILLLSLVLSLFALLQLRNMYSVTEEVSDNWMPSIDYLRKINDSFDAYLVFELRHINDTLTKNKTVLRNSIDSLFNVIEENSTEFLGKIENIKQDSVKTASKEAFEKVDFAIKDFKKHVTDPTLDLSDDFLRDSAMVYRRIPENVQRLKSYRKSMSEMIATNVSGGSTSASTGGNIYWNAKTVLYAVLGAVFILSIFIVVVVSREVSHQVGGEPKKIAEITEKISVGNLDIEMMSHKKERGIYASVKRMVATLKNVVAITEVISKGDTSKKIDPKSTEDMLANSINHMIENFEAQGRVKESMNDLSKVLSGNLPLVEICDKSVSFVSRFSESAQGVIYVFDKNVEKLHLLGTYAFTERNSLSNEYELGKGIIGQVALEKKEILIKNATREDAYVASGLLQKEPNFILAMPLLYENELYGVLEVSSFEPFTPIQKQFMQGACNMIAIYIRTSQQTEEVKRLLHVAEEAKAEAETKSQEILFANTQLAQQQEELRAQAEDLEEANHQMEALNESLEEKIKERTAEIEQKREEIEAQAENLEVEKKKADNLLRNILPVKVAEELKANGKTSTRHYKLATVLFTDFEGFTKIASRMSANQLVQELNAAFAEFDAIIEKYHLEKIKTIGDAYMCAGGLPEPNFTNPIDTVLAGLEIQRLMTAKWEEKQALGKDYWRLRLGINSGEVIAGVIGTKKFAYDIWGDTVNSASRMESMGETGKVNISQNTYNYVKDFFDCEHRGKVVVKGKGEMDMYFVKSIKARLSVDNLGIEPAQVFYDELKFFKEELSKETVEIKV